MESALADSGFVIALVNSSDQRHSEVRSIYDRYPRILLPRLALVEVTYLVGRDAGVPTAIIFLKGLPASQFELVDAIDTDIGRAADIMHQYADSKIDFVDACIMAISERLKITTILTIDQRDFSLFRPLHCRNFTLLP